MSDKKFYITTAIPYVNAAPHIGHALEFVQADCIARLHRLLGERVTLLSGGDENALKNVEAAEKAGKPIQEFIDGNASLFSDLANALGVRFDVFQKGSDTKTHYPASQKLWNLCLSAGDIYKKSYEGLYCVGCEGFYTADELNEQGECPEHPGKPLTKVAEENWFFRLSNYRDRLVDLIDRGALTIVPESRKNEVVSFLRQPLQDISISRSNARAKNWGVPVPGDDTQRMYVWFDALNIYQSGIGFGWDDARYADWWPADVHVIGKGITRFHAVYWPAFLMSAGLPLPRTIFVHGYFTVEGQKMSKTLGNVIDPFGLIKTYGADPIRYYFLREIPSFNDGDFSESRFRELYNADLANGLGNLIARVARLASQTEGVMAPPPQSFADVYGAHEEYRDAFASFRMHDAAAYVWKLVREADRFVDTNQPWKQTGAERMATIQALVPRIQTIATLLGPFMPETSGAILAQFGSGSISAGKPLFPRLG